MFFFTFRLKDECLKQFFSTSFWKRSLAGSSAFVFQVQINNDIISPYNNFYERCAQTFFYVINATVND